MLQITVGSPALLGYYYCMSSLKRSGRWCSHRRSLMTLRIVPRRILWGLSLTIGSLGLLSSATKVAYFCWDHDHLWGFSRLLALDQEANLPTWYSSATLLFCSLLLTLIALAKRQARDRFAGHWGALA